MLEQSAASSALTEKNLAEQISWIILFLIQSPTQEMRSFCILGDLSVHYVH